MAYYRDDEGAADDMWTMNDLPDAPSKHRQFSRHPPSPHEQEAIEKHFTSAYKRLTRGERENALNEQHLSLYADGNQPARQLELRDFYRLKEKGCNSWYFNERKNTKIFIFYVRRIKMFF